VLNQDSLLAEQGVLGDEFDSSTTKDVSSDACDWVARAAFEGALKAVGESVLDAADKAR